jgi:hypothetical protein
MTKVVGVLSAATAAAILSVAPMAHATLTWVQEPGLATDIGVAANDTPWIVDMNGVVQYGTPTEACGSGICVDTGDVTWHALAGTLAHIAVALDNQILGTDPSRGEVWFPQTSDDHNQACNYTVSNWMSDFDQWYGLTFRYSSGAVSSTGSFALKAGYTSPPICVQNPLPITLFGIAWSDSSVQQVTTEVLQLSNGQFGVSNPYWSNTGGVAKQVTLFSEVSGSTITQTPWAVTSNGQLWFFDASWVPVEGPAWSTGKTVPGGVTYATDSWVVAGNFVWAWLAGASGERRTGSSAQDYDEIMGPPPSATIAKIAVAGAYPALGCGGSRIWALDTANRIYVWRTLWVAILGENLIA